MPLLPMRVKGQRTYQLMNCLLSFCELKKGILGLVRYPLLKDPERAARVVSSVFLGGDCGVYQEGVGYEIGNAESWR